VVAAWLGEAAVSAGVADTAEWLEVQRAGMSEELMVQRATDVVSHLEKTALHAASGAEAVALVMERSRTWVQARANTSRRPRTSTWDTEEILTWFAHEGISLVSSQVVAC